MDEAWDVQSLIELADLNAIMCLMSAADHLRSLSSWQPPLPIDSQRCGYW